MSGKTVELKLLDPKKVDAFVETGNSKAMVIVPTEVERVVPMRQLTVEIPESQHAQLRMQCARLNIKSYEVVRKALSGALRELESMNRSTAIQWLNDAK